MDIVSETSLTWSTRIRGFATCFLVGFFFSLLGSLTLFLGKGWVHFAVFYSLGNLISMLSTCFLMGPINQIKKMFAETRIFATILVFVMICLTIFSALQNKTSLAFLFIVLQWLAMSWYSLSYIPYARDAVKKTVTTCIA